MISLPNPNTKMELTQDQYDKLLALYIEQIVDGMDLDSLVQFASDTIEENLRATCSAPDELIEEISQFYDEEFVNDLVESVTQES
jgi:phage pi2 protein 07